MAADDWCNAFTTLGCDVDWAAWGAIATAAAVIYAILAGRMEHKRALHVQKLEESAARVMQRTAWEREDQQRNVRTARLANLFSRDIVYAARQLTMVLANLEPVRFAAMGEEGISYLHDGLPKHALQNVERFADDLDGFENRDAIALLAALASWQEFSEGVLVPPHHLSRDRARRIAENIRTTAFAMRTMHVELNERMITYFVHMPELTGIVTDDVPEEVLEIIKGSRQTGGHPQTEGVE